MLKELAKNTYAAEYLHTFWGIPFPIRMTAIVMESGKVLLHSPIPLSEALAAEVEGLGPVAWIVAPNNFHHVYVQDWVDRFAGVELVVAPGLIKKRPDLKPDHVLGSDLKLWNDELQVRYLDENPFVGESIFFHPLSGSMLVSDFMLNVQQDLGWLARMVFRFEGTYKKCRVPIFFRATRKRKDSAATREQIQRWNPSQVIVAHGDVWPVPDPSALEGALAKL